jgi:hypothetical protein
MLNWKQVGVLVNVSGKDLRANSGPEQLFDLRKGLMEQAINSFSDGLSTDVYSDGTATTNKQPTGLQAALPTCFGTAYAEIDGSANTTWQNQAYTSVGPAATNLVDKLRTGVNAAEDVRGRKSKVDGLFCPFVVQEALAALIDPRVRYAPGGNGEMSNDPVWRNVPIMADSYCPSGTMYGLSSDNIFLGVHPAADMNLTGEGFQQPLNGDSLSGLLIWQGNVVVTTRRVHVTWTGIT